MLTLPLSLLMHPCLQAFTERHQPYNPNLYGRLPASKFDTRKSFQGSHLNRRCPAVQWINSRRVKNCMLCVICICRGGSASVSFSEVEERAVDLRNVSTVPSQSEPTRYVRSRTSLGLSMPTRGSLLTTQLVRLGRSKVTELCSRTGTELDLADQTLVVVSISTPVGQIPFSVPQIASRLTRFACCLASRSDRT